MLMERFADAGDMHNLTRSNDDGADGEVPPARPMPWDRGS